MRYLLAAGLTFLLAATLAGCAARRTAEGEPNLPRVEWMNNLARGLRHQMSADSVRELFTANGFDCAAPGEDGFSCRRRHGSLLYIVPTWRIYDVMLVNGRFYTLTSRHVTQFDPPAIGRQKPEVPPTNRQMELAVRAGAAHG